MANDLHTGFDETLYPYINKGLDGVVAFSTTKSSIDGQNGELIYTGYNIDVLAEKSTFEEVCFLLWNDRLPTQNELNDLTHKLQARRDIPKVVVDYLAQC
jgi:citrate synthase